MKKTTLFVALALAFNSLAQRVESEKITYTYTKLPTNPVQPKPTTYNATVTAAYDAENQKLMAQYEADKAQAEADYQRDMADYPNKVKAADEKFEREMKAWNEKSTASKIIEKQVLNENNKPVKDYVPQPYRRTISMPVMKTAYDYNSLASTYLFIDGLQKGTANALNYTVTLQGFEATPARIVTEVKDEVTRKDGISTTNKVTYYHIEFTYRHPMSFRVSNAINQEIYAAAPAEFTEFKLYKGTASKTQPSMDVSAVVKSMEDKCLQDNLKTINHLVNDRIGYERTEETFELYFVKSKNESHNDLLDAFNAANLGFKMLGTNEAQGAMKLNEAIAIWNKALEESDIENKKARIDKDATIAIYFNLMEAYFALRNTTAADEILKTMGRMDISNREKKQREAYEQAFIDLKLRMAANGL
ncbi:MAG: hypothetical protein ACKOWX_07525 [Flavobacteriales bacterium]